MEVKKIDQDGDKISGTKLCEFTGKFEDADQTSSSQVIEEEVDIPTILTWLTSPKDAPRVTISMAAKLRAQGLIKNGNLVFLMDFGDSTYLLTERLYMTKIVFRNAKSNAICCFRLPTICLQRPRRLSTIQAQHYPVSSQTWVRTPWTSAVRLSNQKLSKNG